MRSSVIMIKNRDWKNGDCPASRCLPKIGTVPIFLVVMLLLITTAYASENSESAQRFYEGVVRAQPENANAHFDLGNVYLTEKRYADALAHYRKAGHVGLAASRMDSYYFNLAVCHEGLGNMDDAVKALEECLKINPRKEGAKDLLAIYKSKMALSP